MGPKSKLITRREFTRQGLATSILSVGGLVSCKSRGNGKSGTDSAYSTRIEPKPLLKVRMNVFSDAAQNDILLYRAAIAAMRQRDEELGNLDGTDPLSWEGQANIHEESCPHGNWFFLPWHRAYLIYFESIIQFWAKRAGDAGNAEVKAILDQGHQFALPYWEWSRMKMPDFMLKDDVFNISNWKKPDGSILYSARSENPQFEESFMGANRLSELMKVTDFEIFGSGYSPKQRRFGSFGMLEGVFHNNIHGAVGGEMIDLNSPRDPIFWMHHANVDRLWAEWQGIMGANAYPSIPDDFKMWRQFKLTGFFDVQGQAQTALVEDMFRHFNLGYTYDTINEDKVVVPDQASANLALAPAQQVESGIVVKDSYRVDENVVKFSLGSLTRFPLLNSFITQNASAEKVIRMKIRNVPIPSADSSVNRVIFYLSGSDYKQLKFIDSFTFFGMKHHHGDHENTINLSWDISGAMRRQLIATQVPLKTDGQLRLGIAMVTGDGKAQPKDVEAYVSLIKAADLAFEFS